MRDLMVIGPWMLATLAVIDVAINVVFPYPKDPRVPPSQLKAFFEYGRSVEGKLARMVGTDDTTSAPIATVGWRVPPLGSREPTRPAAGCDLLVAIYGQSFSDQVGKELERLDPKTTVRFWGGPGSPPSAAYGFYLADRGSHEAEVVILGLLASSVVAMDSTSGMNCQFESPAPYTYPKFVPNGAGGLTTIELGIRTLAELRTALATPLLRDSLRDAMRRSDAYFAPYLFDRNPLDASALVRIVRRALAHEKTRAVRERIHTRDGFVADSPVVSALRLLVVEFAQSVRRDGKVPMLLLFNDRGYSDHLYRCLAEPIAANDIPYLSTHTVCSADDPNNFVSDGHFKPEVNIRIARAAASVYESHLHRRDRAKGAASGNP